MNSYKIKKIGTNYEYRVLKKFREAGIEGRRLPLSMEQDNPKVDLKLSDGRTVQCKYNFKAKRIYKIMELLDFLVIRERGHNKEDYIIMRLSDYLNDVKNA